VKELTVLSGKGGTGKTSLVASFAALAESKVLADCDVDAADLHLIIAPDPVTRNVFRGGFTARIDHDSCTGCGTCIDLCRFGAVSSCESPGGAAAVFSTVDRLGCEGCGVCAHFCEAGAIEMEESDQGEWFVSQTRHGPMVHARLGIAAENSGKLVSLIRNRARTLAEERGLELVIVDGSPGIGCPVIASVTGCDLVLAVTEPTLSGLHDLERVVLLAGHFDAPVAVVVNKYDLNEEMALEIEQWCADRKIRIAGRIPYSGEFTAAMIAGQSVVEHAAMPASQSARAARSASQAVRKTWEAALDMLREAT
jgi:MinD superfamily P-loop ATPase